MFSWERILAGAMLVAMLLDLHLIFNFAPEQESMGHIQRIFYFHVPSAWVAFLAFFVVFVGSIMYLWKRDRKYDIVASASAELGVVFSTLVLITGPIWARPVWNTWWEWSPRLTLFLVLWFIFVAYLMLRAFVDDREKAARFSAVFGIFGFVDVPIVYMSIRLWRDIHPKPVTDGGLHPDMATVLYFSLLTFTLIYLYILIQRVRLEHSVIRIRELKLEIA